MEHGRHQYPNNRYARRRRPVARLLSKVCPHSEETEQTLAQEADGCHQASYVCPDGSAQPKVNQPRQDAHGQEIRANESESDPVKRPRRVLVTPQWLVAGWRTIWIVMRRVGACRQIPAVWKSLHLFPEPRLPSRFFPTRRTLPLIKLRYPGLAHLWTTYPRDSTVAAHSTNGRQDCRAEGCKRRVAS